LAGTGWPKSTNGGKNSAALSLNHLSYGAVEAANSPDLLDAVFRRQVFFSWQDRNCETDRRHLRLLGHELGTAPPWIRRRGHHRITRAMAAGYRSEAEGPGSHVPVGSLSDLRHTR
jgi:hypothetical protein